MPGQGFSAGGERRDEEPEDHRTRDGRSAVGAVGAEGWARALSVCAFRLGGVPAIARPGA